MNAKLYVVRREKGLKQKEVANLLGIHPQTYHLKEKGKEHFTIPEALMVARIMGVTLNDLFWESSEEVVG
ncbi:helix-turn-helix transcriptional regulator [Terribacillus saccharophilus]|uniref:helix-turn-helix transcriptional regulator n=1 Tax=Terribacillus saccharophilus TaxID=361277 RepID=UPI002DCFD17E|nr:helix-turn-helix domain-containing protein [Terribacillus saccharophilus]MEC0288945.1 helix-turn-helix domain-containing protein [Terribacillus saccharophilus]